MVGSNPTLTMENKKQETKNSSSLHITKKEKEFAGSLFYELGDKTEPFLKSLTPKKITFLRDIFDEKRRLKLKYAWLIRVLVTVLVGYTTFVLGIFFVYLIKWAADDSNPSDVKLFANLLSKVGLREKLLPHPLTLIADFFGKKSVRKFVRVLFPGSILFSAAKWIGKKYTQPNQEKLDTSASSFWANGLKKKEKEIAGSLFYELGDKTQPFLDSLTPKKITSLRNQFEKNKLKKFFLNLHKELGSLIAVFIFSMSIAYLLEWILYKSYPSPVWLFQKCLSKKVEKIFFLFVWGWLMAKCTDLFFRELGGKDGAEGIHLEHVSENEKQKNTGRKR